MNRSRINGIILFTAIFIVVCVIRYHDFLFMMPNGIHEGAQSDRLSLAIQYYDRGMNFFLPRTYNISPIDGVTATEFPIQSYLAAAMGHVFGRDSISIAFRLLTLLITYFGLLSLFLTCLRATNDGLISLFLPFFLFCSPAFAYYACNYLPDCAAASISFIGFGFFYSYLESGTYEFKQLLRAILLLTLATLIKTTLGIVLLSVMGYIVYNTLFVASQRHKKTLFAVAILFASSVAVILAYYFYNQYLNRHYGAHIFLQSVNPFKGWDEVKLYFLFSIRHTFVNEYYVISQYPFIIMILATGIVIFLNKRQTVIRPVFFLCMFAGAAMATYLFGHQLIHHDYYFISIWMPAITITMLIFIIEIKKLVSSAYGSRILNTATLSALVVIFVFSHSYFKSRITLEDYRYPGFKKALASNWMQGGSKIMDKLGIGKDSTIYILDEAPPNLGLLYFDRRGLNGARESWNNGLSNVKEYMHGRDIRIMVCDARKVPGIKATNTVLFDELFTELYTDSLCAVYYLEL